MTGYDNMRDTRDEANHSPNKGLLDSLLGLFHGGETPPAIDPNEADFRDIESDPAAVPGDVPLRDIRGYNGWRSWSVKATDTLECNPAPAWWYVKCINPGAVAGIGAWVRAGGNFSPPAALAGTQELGGAALVADTNGDTVVVPARGTRLTVSVVNAACSYLVIAGSGFDYPR